MRVLVACEFSGVVRRAFREAGHEAYSIDLLPAEDNSPHHILGDVNFLLSPDPYAEPWDLMIAHPPCTFLCNSGVHLLHNKAKNGTEEEWYEEYLRVNRRFASMIEAREFFLSLWTAPIPKICIENPVPHGYANLPKYDQTIQPYMFGDDASKRTCLWLKGLEPLSVPPESTWVQPRIVDGKKRWSNQTDSGQNKLGPSVTRASERSRTYAGIARAFVDNWGHG